MVVGNFGPRVVRAYQDPLGEISEMVWLGMVRRDIALDDLQYRSFRLDSKESGRTS
jgi:hypothetical protein